MDYANIKNVAIFKRKEHHIGIDFNAVNDLTFECAHFHHHLLGSLLFGRLLDLTPRVAINVEAHAVRASPRPSLYLAKTRDNVI